MPEGAGSAQRPACFSRNRTLEENSPDRPLLRVALTPGFAVTAHRAAYDVTVLADPGGVGPAMLPRPRP